MTRRRLPIGIQTFRTLRERDCYYVDKTAYVERLLDEGTHYFLSRPRRFGKSLFLDTLKELFEGSEELFAGLHIHAGHDWSERHPVVRLSFGGGNFRESDLLDANVMEQLAAAERRLGVPRPAALLDISRSIRKHAYVWTRFSQPESTKTPLRLWMVSPSLCERPRNASSRTLSGSIARRSSRSQTRSINRSAPGGGRRHRMSCTAGFVLLLKTPCTGIRGEDIRRCRRLDLASPGIGDRTGIHRGSSCKPGVRTLGWRNAEGGDPLLHAAG